MYSIDKIQEAIDNKYISKVKHPTKDLYILNYTKKAEKQNYWTQEVMMCRGLVVDGDWNVVSKPFGKFFNDFELDQMGVDIPWDEEFKAYEKLDGSLGISYWDGEKMCIATRGSFTSSQAEHATNLLNTKYKDVKLNPLYTYLFEIIYPENRIVVDYGTNDDIYLLAVIETSTGIEQDLSQFANIGFETVKEYECKDLKTIRDQFSSYNREGFVIKFKNGSRMKVKYDRYFEIHAALSGLSLKKVFYMIVSNDFIKLIALKFEGNAERNKKIDEWIDLINNTTNKVIDEARSVYKDFEDDKEAAKYFLQYKELSPILFKMRKGQGIYDNVMKVVKNRLSI